MDERTQFQTEQRETWDKINTKLDAVFKDTELEDYNYCDFETAEGLIEDLQEQISQHEVIYYSNAMEYLSEHDNSLNESMALASEMGYECGNINSELLATLLQQQNLNNELSELTSEIEDCFEEDEVDE